MTTMIHSIHCIIPPHMLDAVAQRGNANQRVWALSVLSISERTRGRREALGAFPAAVPTGTKRRTVYDAKHGSALPGVLVRGENDPPTSDTTVNEAYDGAGATYDLYYEVYQRASIDDRGLRLDSTVHYEQDYDNAFWDGHQMVYGDGDGQLFDRFTKSVDVIGHELTHGVTQYEAGLIYHNQSGALNESFSDVFGSLVKQRKLGQSADKADWLIGQGLFTSRVRGVALRSMQAPGTAYDDPTLGKDRQPAHMKDYKQMPDTSRGDFGGVHINSGIPNHAFYLAATAIGGNAWEKAGRIWYITLRDRLRNRAQFQDAANSTFLVAGELFGVGSREQSAVRNGWAGVGITVK